MKKIRFCDAWEFWKDGQESSRQQIDLPHDAMIHEKRDPALEGGNATGFYPGGKYYYKKEIFGAEDYKDKTILVEFEGVYMNATVYLNDEKVGGWIYGYTNFYVDLTGKLLPGKTNTLVVEVDNSKTPNSRWYSGSGIYRPVNLWIGDKYHILPQGVKVKTVSTDPAEIEVSVAAVMAPDMCLCCEIIDENGKVIATGAPEDGVAAIKIPQAKLWSDETPNLYHIRTRLKKDNRLLDEAVERFGIRLLTWDASHGFQVNGQTVKLRGGCIHHDNGMLGACTYDTAERRRLEKMKAFGFNAIRSSHNPAGKNLLDICDELGMYVLDESFDQWKVPQSTYDYAGYFDQEWKKDVEALVSKDYNHPSVIMYCIGNEITDTGLPHGAAICKLLNDEFHRLDATRPTTIANNAMLSVMADLQSKKQSDTTVGSSDVNDVVALLPKIMASITAESLEALCGECFKNVDIVGYNYGTNLYEKTHERIGDRIILSTETFPSHMADNWKAVEAHAYVIGDFLWTAWDYLGETGVGVPTYNSDRAPFSKPYPCLTASCGSFDLNGNPETQAYYNAILWGAYDRPYIAVRPLNHSKEAYTLGSWRQSDAIPSWDWAGHEGKTAQIEVYGRGASVELILNGKSAGVETFADCKAVFELPYAAGTLEAVTYDGQGNVLGRETLSTTGNQTYLSICPEAATMTASEDALAYVHIRLVDAQGNLKMNEDRKIHVSVSGAGELLAFGSARPETEESFYTGEYTTWHGQTLAIIKKTQRPGTVTLSARIEDTLIAESKLEVW